MLHSQAVACREAVTLGEDELVLLDVVVVLRVNPLHAAQQVVDHLGLRGEGERPPHRIELPW